MKLDHCTAYLHENALSEALCIPNDYNEAPGVPRREQLGFVSGSPPIEHEVVLLNSLEGLGKIRDPLAGGKGDAYARKRLQTPGHLSF